MDQLDQNELDPMINFLTSIQSFKTNKNILNFIFTLKSFQMRSEVSKQNEPKGSSFKNIDNQMTSNKITNLVHNNLTGFKKSLGDLNDINPTELKSFTKFMNLIIFIFRKINLTPTPKTLLLIT